MGKQTELVVCKKCEETDIIKEGDPCLNCGEIYKKEKPHKPTAWEIYMHEVGEARDRYIKAMKKEKLSKEEEEKMYAEEDKGEISWKKELIDSPEMKGYLDKVQKAREDFMKEKLAEHLSEEDSKKFKTYEELADYFAGGDRVRTLYQGNGYADANLGIMINGEEYWMKEKDIEI